MKLTKGMKKALSLLLSAAMVVTGVNVTTNAANPDKLYFHKKTTRQGSSIVRHLVLLFLNFQFPILN